MHRASVAQCEVSAYAHIVVNVLETESADTSNV